MSLVLALCLGGTALSACDSAMGETRRLVWSDEFDGDRGALPDPDKWQIETFADPTDLEKQCYTDDPVNVSTDGEGHLVIAAIARAGNCADGWYRFVTSGRITTQGLHTWEHGRFEIRAQVPAGVGTWPAFWALGQDKPGVEWPRTGEIDVMEYVGRDPTHLIGTVHGPTDSGEHWFLQGSVDAEEPLSGDFHTYAVDWNEDRLVWYLNGEQYAKVTREEAEQEGDWVFDKPFYLVLNLAMGGVLGGEIPEATTYPQRLVVDYVRVSQ